MADYLSTQATKLAAVPLQRLATDELGGRIRVAYFDFTVPAGNVATAKTIELTRIPAGARLLGGKIAFEAMSTAGGTAQIQIGDGTTAAKYLGTTSVDTAGISDFGDTAALNYGEKLTSELVLTATTAGEAWAATKTLKGHVAYVLD